jgi:hypothetical protein
MNQLIAVAFESLAVVADLAAPGQDRSTLDPDTDYMFGTRPAASGATPGEAFASPLFYFGGLDVDVCSSVKPNDKPDGKRDPGSSRF